MVLPVSGVHLDAVGGIAGDMFIAALLDALPALKDRVLTDAAAVLPPGYAPVLAEGMSGGIRVLRFGLTETPRRETANHHDHAHSTYTAMIARIRQAKLAAGTADQACAILTLLADAEAKIHGVTRDQVHFHEIGDWDSLMDVVAAGSIAAALLGARWTVSDLPRGGGMVKTQHGLMPVPAPATAALLTGFSWRDDGIGGERVTPTGAAILRHLTSTGAASGRLQASGAGAGTRDLPGMPNVLRALVFEDAGQNAASRETISVISFEVDDMTGEEIATAADRLRAVKGVLDLSIGRRAGKKGRAMESFGLLVKPEAADAVTAQCFAETSTVGLRVRDEHRVVLSRKQATVDGVGIKTVPRGDGTETTKAESDDLTGDTLAARRARKHRAENGS